MALTRVQAPTSTSGSSTAPSITFAGTPAQGNLMIATISLGGTPTISLAGWTEIPTHSPVNSGVSSKEAYFYKIAGASESKTVTGVLGSSTTWRMFVVEYNDSANGTWTLDAHSNAVATVSPVSSGSVTTTRAVEILVACLTSASGRTQSAPTNGFTLISGTATAPAAYLYEKFDSATETTSCGATLSGSANNVGIIATFYVVASITPVSATDSGGGTDAQALVAKLVSADTGSGADVGTVKSKVVSAQTGSGIEVGVPRARVASIQTNGTTTESGVVKQKYSSADTGSGVDSITSRKTATREISSGADVGTVKSKVLPTDVGSGVDVGVPRARVVSSEVGAGSDAQTSKAKPVSADTGSGVDAVLNRKSQVLDSGSGVDAQLAKPKIAGTDVGSGADAAIPRARIAAVEAGAGVDTQSAATGATPKASTDAGSGADTQIVRVRVASTEIAVDRYTVLLLHLDGTSGSTVFTDSSSYGHIITSNGNVQVDTSVSRSIPTDGVAIFDGTGDFLTTPDSADLDLGAGDFTIEDWGRFNSVAATQVLVAQGIAPDLAYRWSFVAPNILRFLYTVDGTTAISADFAWTPSTLTWDHAAIVRVGNILRAFVDGTQVGSDQAISGAIWNSASVLSIGARSDGSNPLNGWLDEIRISKGIARWTSNFSPPVSPYDISAVNGSDVITKRKIASADAGSGAETWKRNARLADSGTGVDAVTSRKIATVDSAAGVDTQTVGVGVVPKSSSDAGSGTDAITKRKIAYIDSTTGVDAGISRPRITSTDVGVGADSQRRIARFADVGSGADTQLVRVRVTSTDSGAGSDTATGKAKSTTADAGTGADTVLKRKSQVLDNGAGTDAVLKRKVASADSGTAAESASSQTPNSKSSTQTGVGTDSAVVRVRVTNAQTGAGADTLTFAARLTSSQVGAGVETQVARPRIPSTQLGSGAETYLVRARVTSSDLGAGTDTPKLKAKYSRTDAGSGTEVASQTHVVNADLLCTFKVRVLTHVDLVCTFAVVSSNRADLVGVYNITGSIGANLTVVYTLTGPVRVDLVVVYQIFGAVPIITGIITRQHGAVATLEQVLDTEGLIRRAATGNAEFEIQEKAQGIVTRDHPAKVKERVYA